jgi:hypothetical protein
MVGDGADYREVFPEPVAYTAVFREETDQAAATLPRHVGMQDW